MRSPLSLVRRGVLCLTLAGLSLFGVTFARACPFCSAPSLTLTEQLSGAQTAVYAKQVGGTEPAGTDAGTTDFEVVEVLHQPEGKSLKVGDKLTLIRYRAPEADKRFLLLSSSAATGLEWGSPIEVTESTLKYLKAAPRGDEPSEKRLAYFMQFLEDPQVVIADDAYAEFANAPYEQIKGLADKMPREKLRKWLFDPKVSPSRLGLYGLMLGLCGTEDDVTLMEQKIYEPTEDFRLGIDGIMGGYLLLTGERGLESLENHKIKNKKVPFSETYATMQALRFMQQYGDNRIPLTRLQESMRLLLNRPELADLVIADLARWQDWTIQDRLMALYDDDEYAIPSIKRAIIRYMIASSKAVPEGASGAAVPAHVARGKEILAVLEKKDPKTVQDAKRFMFLK